MKLPAVRAELRYHIGIARMSMSPKYQQTLCGFSNPEHAGELRRQVRPVKHLFIPQTRTWCVSDFQD